VYCSENVIGQAIRLSQARADRDFTRSVGPGPGNSDLVESVPGRSWSKVLKMSAGSVQSSYFPDIKSVGTGFNVGFPDIVGETGKWVMISGE